MQVDRCIGVAQLAEGVAGWAVGGCDGSSKGNETVRSAYISCIYISRQCRMHGADARRQLFVETHLKRDKKGKRGVGAGRGGEIVLLDSL